MKKKFKSIILPAVILVITWYTLQNGFGLKTKMDEAPLDYIQQDYTSGITGV